MALLYFFIIIKSIYGIFFTSHTLPFLELTILTKNKTTNPCLPTSQQKYTLFNYINRIIINSKICLITVTKLMFLSLCIMNSNYIKAAYENPIHADDFINIMRNPDIQNKWVFMEFKKI